MSCFRRHLSRGALARVLPSLLVLVPGAAERTRSGSAIIVDKLPYSSTLSYTVARPPVTCVSHIRGVQHLETISGFRGNPRSDIVYGSGPTRGYHPLPAQPGPPGATVALLHCGGHRGWIPHGTTRGRSRNWPRPSRRPKRTRRCSRHWSGISQAIWRGGAGHAGRYI